MGKDGFNVGATDTLSKRFIAICCSLLIFSDVAGISSVKKCAYIGQAAKLFNIDSDYAEPSLYNETETLIASWNGTNNTVAHMNPHYSGKIYMDKERNIWILGVEREDAGKYSVKFGAKLERHEVDIILTVKGSRDSINGLLKTIMLLVILILVINITIIVLNYISEDWIRKCLKAEKNWIQEKLCSEHTKPSAKQLSKSHENTSVAVPIEGSELTEHQVRNWLEGHPEFFEYNESLTAFLVKAWTKLHPDFIKKYDEQEDTHQFEIPAHDDLSVRETCTKWNELKVIRKWTVSTEMKDIAVQTFSSHNSGYVLGGRFRKRLRDYSEDTKEHLGYLMCWWRRKVMFDFSEDPEEYLGYLTGEQIWQIRKLLDDYSEDVKEYLDAIESFRDKDCKDVQSAPNFDMKAAPKGVKSQTGSLDQSGKWMKDPNSDNDNNEPLLDETFNPK